MTARTQAKPLPKVVGRTVQMTVAGSKPGTTYHVYIANDGAWVCHCQSWKNQPGVVGKDRSCKHTNAAAVALGEMVVKTLGGGA